MPPTFNALLDSSTNVLLALSPLAAGIAFLTECTPNTKFAGNVQYPNYTKSGWFGRSSFFLAKMNTSRYPEFTWDATNRLFVHSLPGAVTPQIRERSALAVAKLHVVANMIMRLSTARTKLQKGVLLQDAVYRHKEAQARAFKNSGYNEDMVMDIPFVVQYADFKGISLKEAADDIIFKVRLDQDVLAKTELLRLKFFDRVKLAKSVPEMATIEEDFIRDFHVNARL